MAFESFLLLPVCVGLIVILIVALIIFYIFSVYNGLISLKNNIERAWANIDVLLKQRSDLIPNLVETVKGYMKHERGVLEDLTRMRAQMLSAQGPAQKAKASEALTSALRSIFAVAENYPQLRASENFLQLQNQLSSIENQIADRREFYNESVVLFNTRIHSVPDMFFASLMGFKDKEYFKATEGEKENVKVEL